MRARSGVVAGNPVLIVRAAVINNDRLAPVNPVGRAAGGHGFSITVNEGKSRNQPYLMFCVVSDSRVAGRGEASAFVIVRQAGKIAAGPGFARICRSSKPYVSAAAVGDARYLETAHNSGSPRERIWFNLGAMLGVRVMEGVRAELDERGLGMRARDQCNHDPERQRHCD